MTPISFSFRHSFFYFIMAHFSNSHNVQFEGVVSRPPDLPLVPTIPRISHAVHTKLSEMTWRNYTSACAFVEKIGVEKLDIWVPEGEELPDEMWEGIKNLPNVVVRPFHVPKGVWGKKLDHPAHWSDVSRIKILFEEGGAYGLLWMKSHSSTFTTPSISRTPNLFSHWAGNGAVRLGMSISASANFRKTCGGTVSSCSHSTAY